MGSFDQCYIVWHNKIFVFLTATTGGKMGDFTHHSTTALDVEVGPDFLAE